MPSYAEPPVGQPAIQSFDERDPAALTTADAMLRRLKTRPSVRRIVGMPVVKWLRFRGRSAAHFGRRGHVIRARVIRRYLASSQAPRLQLGAGPFPLEGWLNSDLISGDIYLDMRRSLPFPDRSLAYVSSEQAISELSEPEGVALLTEIHRVLRPGGVARLTTADLRKIIAIYEDRNPVITREDYGRFLDRITAARHERACQIMNSVMRAWGQRYVYDEEDLTAKLLAAGFDRVTRLEPGESADTVLRDIERHGRGLAEWENAAEAMCLEAVRET